MRNIIGRTNMNNIKGIKKILKPVVEKKRRDRINQSLGDLKTLLLNFTCDARLQNPKVEKAEILDLAVEYLQKRTARQTRNVVHTPPQRQIGDVSQADALPDSPSDSRHPVLPISSSTGFQQCVSQLAGFLSRATPAERDGLCRGLTSYMDDQYPAISSPGQRPCPATNTDFHHPGSNWKSDAASMNNTGCRSKLEAAKSPLLLNYSSCQPGGYSYPLSPDSLSPPASPCLSCSSFTTPPPFSSLPCHFLFPPSLSPLSSSSSPSCSCSLSRRTAASALGLSPTLPLPSPPSLRLPSHPPQRPLDPTTRPKLFTNFSQSVWRPWF